MSQDSIAEILSCFIVEMKTFIAMMRAGTFIGKPVLILIRTLTFVESSCFELSSAFVLRWSSLVAATFKNS
jgi:hypothetical protein